MKYTIEGFSQQRLVDLGLDTVDACLLRWFVDFQATGRMEEEFLKKPYHFKDGKIETKEIPFYWVNYGYVIKQMPVLGIKSLDAMGRRFLKLAKAGVLLSSLKKTPEGSKMFFSCATYPYNMLISDTNDGFSNSHPTFDPSSHPTQKSGNSSIKEIHQSLIMSQEFDTQSDTPEKQPGNLPSQEETIQIEKVATVLIAERRKIDPKFLARLGPGPRFDKLPSSWVVPIWNIHRFDGRSWEQIIEVVRWSQSDDCLFVVESGASLRKKFSSMLVAMKKPKPGFRSWDTPKETPAERIARMEREGRL